MSTTIIASQRNQALHKSCLGMNSEILTENGWKTFDQLIVGEHVWSFDPMTRELFLSQLNGTTLRYENDVATVQLSGFTIPSTFDHVWVDSDGGVFCTGDGCDERKLLRVEDLFPVTSIHSREQDGIATLAGIIARWGMLHLDGSQSVSISLRDDFSDHLVNAINAVIERCFWNAPVQFEPEARTTTWIIHGEAAMAAYEMACMPYPFTPSLARDFLAGYSIDHDDITAGSFVEESAQIIDKIQHCAVLNGLRTYIRQERASELYTLKVFQKGYGPSMADVLRVYTHEGGATVWSPEVNDGWWIARIRNVDYAPAPYVNYVSNAFLTGGCSYR